MSDTSLRPLGFGEILDGAFQLYRRHFVTMFVTALLPMIPIALVSSTWVGEFARMDETGEFSAAAVASLMAFGVAMVALYPPMFVALTRQFSQACIGGTVSVADGYRRSVLTSVYWLMAGLLVGIVWSIVVGAVALVVMLLFGVLAAVTAAFSGAVATVLAGVAVVLMMIGFFAAYAGLAAALMGLFPPLVVERADPATAISRWVRLARGALGRVLGITVVVAIVFMLPNFAVVALTGAAAGWGPALTGHLPAGVMWAQQLLGALVGAAVYPFFMGAFVLLYYDRRVRVDALDVEIAAARLPVAV